MSYNHRKPYKTNFSHGKALGADRWDHSGFDQLQNEMNQAQNREEKNYKQSKSNYDQVSGSNTERSKTMKSSNHREGLDGKWLHDKFEEAQDYPVGGYSNSNTDHAQQRKKRPDRVLYSVRDKQVKESNSSDVNTTINSNIETTPRNKHAKNMFGKDDKDVLSIEDDSKSYTSNVSTAFSERIKPLDDDFFANRDSVLTERTNEKLFSNKKDDSHLLFEINLENDGYCDTIKVYDNEDDYESFLDTICLNFNIKDELALHFKIYVLYLIKESNHPDFGRIEPLYLKLLDMNYELIMNDCSKSQFDDSLDLADFDSSQTACDKFINDQ